MDIKVRSIGGEYSEMEVDEINTGTLDKQGSLIQACALISAAEDLITNAGIEDYGISNSLLQLITDLNQ